MQISKKTLVHFLKRHIKTSAPVADQVANIIVSNTHSELIGVILDLLLTEELIHTFSEGDYFRARPPYKHKGEHFFEDTLTDLGLYVDGYVFGRVLSSSDWNSDHDPYYLKVNCELFYGDVKPLEHSFSILEIEKVERNSIPHFNGSYINRIVNPQHAGVDDIKDPNEPDA